MRKYAYKTNYAGKQFGETAISDVWTGVESGLHAIGEFFSPQAESRPQKKHSTRSPKKSGQVVQTPASLQERKSSESQTSKTSTFEEFCPDSSIVTDGGRSLRGVGISSEKVCEEVESAF